MGCETLAMTVPLSPCIFSCGEIALRNTEALRRGSASKERVRTDAHHQSTQVNELGCTAGVSHKLIHRTVFIHVLRSGDLLAPSQGCRRSALVSVRDTASLVLDEWARVAGTGATRATSDSVCRTRNRTQLFAEEQRDHLRFLRALRQACFTCSRRLPLGDRR